MDSPKIKSQARDIEKGRATETVTKANGPSTVTKVSSTFEVESPKANTWKSKLMGR